MSKKRPGKVDRRARGRPVEAARDLIPYSRWKLYRAIFAGEIEAVVHSQTVYLDRSSLAAYALAQKNLLPLPGWVPVREAAREAGRSYTSLKEWLTAHNLPLRVFLHPELNRPCRYMRQQDVEVYRRLAPTTDKNVPKRHRQERHTDTPAGKDDAHEETV